MIFLIISTLFTLCLAYYVIVYGKCSEGFQEKASEGNAIVDLVNNIKRINTYLVDPTMWTDRIEMLTMSPVELARREIKKQLAPTTKTQLMSE